MVYLMCFRTIEPVESNNTEIPDGVYLNTTVESRAQTFVEVVYQYWRGTRIIPWAYIEPCNLPV